MKRVRFDALRFCILLAAFACVEFLRWPIASLDCDLWMYLAAGREMFRTWSIPSDSFYSILSPPRVWLDYTWLFQALVYGIFKAAGPLGLILWRAGIFLALTAAVLAMLFLGREKGSSRAFPAAVFALFLMAFLHRAMVVRPHTLVYLFIALFLLVLEKRALPAFLLPALALLWVNFHGLSYPVLLLMLGAYLVQEYAGPRDPRRLLAMGLSLPAVFLTPSGLKLLALPFTPLVETAGFIYDNAPLDPFNLFSLHLTPDGFSRQTLFSLILLLSLASALGRGGTARWILLLGGFSMLLKTSRLQNECCLLCLPFLAGASAPAALSLSPRVRQAVLAALMALPFLHLNAVFSNRPAWPVSLLHLPQGVATFLERVRPGARILNFPVTGDYLAWRLYPRHKITMGMNVTHFFTGDDLYAVRSAFASPEGLRLFLLVHRPDFISAPLEAAHFPGIISKFPDFALVFFDDTDALYADLRAHPELKPLSPGVDPFRPDLFDAGDARNRPEGPGRLPRWLSGMMAVDPRCAATRLWAAEILLRQAAFGAALAHAEAAAADYPDNPVTHVAVGDALLGLGRGEGALASYREALGRTADAASIKGIRRRMALAWLSLKDAGKAYAEFGRFADPHDPFLGRRDLFHLGILALRAGEERGAAAAFRRLYGPGFRAEGNPAFLADLRRWGPLPGN